MSFRVLICIFPLFVFVGCSKGSKPLELQHTIVVEDFGTFITSRYSIIVDEQYPSHECVVFSIYVEGVPTNSVEYTICVEYERR